MRELQMGGHFPVEFMSLVFDKKTSFHAASKFCIDRRWTPRQSKDAAHNGRRLTARIPVLSTCGHFSL